MFNELGQNKTIGAADFLALVITKEIISDYNVTEPLNFDGLKFDAKYFSNIVFSELVFFKGERNSLLVFSHCTFVKGLVGFKGANINELAFIETKFEHISSLNSCTINVVSFFDCQLNSSFSIEDCRVRKLNFSGSSNVDSDLFIKNSLIEECRLSNLNERTNIFMLKAGDKEDEAAISDLNIDCTSPNVGMVVFQGYSFERVRLTGFLQNGKIDFDNCFFNKIEFESFTNSGMLRAISPNINTDSKLKVTLSNLGKLELFDLNFNIFKSIFITRSSIQDIVPNSVTWCDNLESGDIRSTRDVYRQLKNIMIRINDRISELYYHKLEMDTFYVELKSQKGHYEEKFVLGTSRLSNNHGLSWLRAFGWLILISIIVYNANKLLLGYNSFNSSLVFEDIANWIMSINPVRKFTDVYKVYHSGWQYGVAIFLDVLSRIVYSYLIFQFISAFRKYVKK